MKTCFGLGMILVLIVGGCSNDSGTTGPEAFPVELDVRVSAPFHPPAGAAVHVQNLTAVTDTAGLAVFHTDINTLVPNHTYQITVNASGLIQSFPEADTVIVPSAPNRGTSYYLYKTVQVKPQ